MNQKIVKIRKNIRNNVADRLDEYIHKNLYNHSLHNMRCLERAEKLYKIVESAAWVYMGIFQLKRS